MKISIDEIVNSVKPWDLTVEIDGREWGVRRLTSADFKRLADSPKYDEAANRDFTLNLFKLDGTERPNVSGWDAEIVAAVISTIVAYYQSVVIPKNFEAAQQAIAKQLR
ncbi:MAG: hypothetical protein ACTHLZ_00130, partial [Tepidisphaeraceae bacterium]